MAATAAISALALAAAGCGGGDDEDVGEGRSPQGTDATLTPEVTPQGPQTVPEPVPGRPDAGPEGE
jgi:hypothetical protein